MPHSTVNARNWLRKSGAPVCHAFFEATVTRTHTLLFNAPRVGRSTVGSRVAHRLPGRHGRQSTTLPEESCFGAQYLGKAATWCPQVGISPQELAGHVNTPSA